MPRTTQTSSIRPIASAGPSNIVRNDGSSAIAIPSASPIATRMASGGLAIWRNTSALGISATTKHCPDAAATGAALAPDTALASDAAMGAFAASISAVGLALAGSGWQASKLAGGKNGWT